MTFKDNLQKKLKGKIDDKDLEILPSGFQIIGDIIILNLKPALLEFKKEIGKAVLELYPRIKTVCNKTGEITGEFREPQIEIIAGEKKTETIHFENGCYYKLDIKKLMFAKGNINERVRIAKQVKQGEIVVDMFAGLGYFSIPLGKLSKAKKIYSIELNPNAFYYLLENIKLNKIENKVEAIHGDNKKIIPELISKGIIADRIVMGYLPPPKDFLQDAFKIAKEGTIIHYEALMLDENLKNETKKNMDDIEKAAENADFKVKLISVNYIKGYRPRVSHYVLDLKVI